MIEVGQEFISVNITGVLEILSIDGSKIEVKVLIKEDGAETKQIFNFQKFIWGVERGEYIYQKTGKDIDNWIIGTVRDTLKERFGLKVSICSYDPVRVKAGMEILSKYSGIGERYLYSIIETIKTLDV